MKLRIKDNSIRLRLSQSEVKSFNDEDMIMSETRFPAGNVLRYGLRKSTMNEISVSFDAEQLQIMLPTELSESWAVTDRVGIEGKIETSGTDFLTVLVEKDFQCLTERPGEDESDLFPNPMESH